MFFYYNYKNFYNYNKLKIIDINKNFNIISINKNISFNFLKFFIFNVRNTRKIKLKRKRAKYSFIRLKYYFYNFIFRRLRKIKKKYRKLNRILKIKYKHNLKKLLQQKKYKKILKIFFIKKIFQFFYIKNKKRKLKKILHLNVYRKLILKKIFFYKFRALNYNYKFKRNFFKFKTKRFGKKILYNKSYKLVNFKSEAFERDVIEKYNIQMRLIKNEFPIREKNWTILFLSEKNSRRRSFNFFFDANVGLLYRVCLINIKGDLLIQYLFPYFLYLTNYFYFYTKLRKKKKKKRLKRLLIKRFIKKRYRYRFKRIFVKKFKLKKKNFKLSFFFFLLKLKKKKKWFFKIFFFIFTIMRRILNLKSMAKFTSKNHSFIHYYAFLVNLSLTLKKMRLNYQKFRILRLLRINKLKKGSRLGAVPIMHKLRFFFFNLSSITFLRTFRISYRAMCNYYFLHDKFRLISRRQFMAEETVRFIYKNTYLLLKKIKYKKKLRVVNIFKKSYLLLYSINYYYNNKDNLNYNKHFLKSSDYKFNLNKTKESTNSRFKLDFDPIKQNILMDFSVKSKIAFNKYYVRQRKLFVFFYGNFLSFKRLKKIYYLIKRLKKFNVIFFLSYFERLITTVLFRMGFVNKIKDSIIFIKAGLVKVNNKVITSIYFIINNGDLVQFSVLDTYLYRNLLINPYHFNLEYLRENLSPEYDVSFANKYLENNMYKSNLLKHNPYLFFSLNKQIVSKFFGSTSTCYRYVPPHILVNFRIMAGIFIRSPLFFLEDYFLRHTFIHLSNFRNVSNFFFFTLLKLYIIFNKKC